MLNRRIAGAVALSAMAVALAFACTIPGGNPGSMAQAGMTNTAKM